MNNNMTDILDELPPVPVSVCFPGQFDLKAESPEPTSSAIPFTVTRNERGAAKAAKSSKETLRGKTWSQYSSFHFLSLTQVLATSRSVHSSFLSLPTCRRLPLWPCAHRGRPTSRSVHSSCPFPHASFASSIYKLDGFPYGLVHIEAGLRWLLEGNRE